MREKIDWNKDLDTRQAAEYLGVTVSTLTNRRSQGKGPRYLKDDGKVRYTKEDLDRWKKKQAKIEKERAKSKG